MNLQLIASGALALLIAAVVPGVYSDESSAIKKPVYGLRGVYDEIDTDNEEKYFNRIYSKYVSGLRGGGGHDDGGHGGGGGGGDHGGHDDGGHGGGGHGGGGDNGWKHHHGHDDHGDHGGHHGCPDGMLGCNGHGIWHPDKPDGPDNHHHRHHHDHDHHEHRHYDDGPDDDDDDEDYDRITDDEEGMCSGPPEEYSDLCEKLKEEYCDTPEDLEEYSVICKFLGFDDDYEAME